MSQKILVVDDNTDLVDLLESEFLAGGLEVVAAPSGRDALNKLSESFCPDLILLDVRMPEMSGQQFLDELEKKYPELLKRTPILFSSAGAPPADRRVSGFIDKMTDLPDYISKIKHCLRPPTLAAS